MIRVLLADDHELLRKGVRALLETHENIEVCGEAVDGHDTIQQVIDLKPDVTVLDLSMPGINGLEVTTEIRRRAPETEVLIFSAQDSENMVREVLGAGARGFIFKADASSHLTAAIEAVASHNLYFSAGVSQMFVNSFVGSKEKAPAADRGSILSSREIEITAMLAEGKSNKKIASELFISVRTVETHRRTIFQKLEISSVAELVKYAIRSGIARA
jgi:DNA-binding NarL/FixJ family response regulator